MSAIRSNLTSKIRWKSLLLSIFKISLLSECIESFFTKILPSKHSIKQNFYLNRQQVLAAINPIVSLLSFSSRIKNFWLKIKSFIRMSKISKWNLRQSRKTKSLKEININGNSKESLDKLMFWTSQLQILELS